MVSTPLSNISQNGNLPQIGVKIKNIWNHHPVYVYLISPPASHSHHQVYGIPFLTLKMPLLRCMGVDPKHIRYVYSTYTVYIYITTLELNWYFSAQKMLGQKLFLVLRWDVRQHSIAMSSLDIIWHQIKTPGLRFSPPKKNMKNHGYK